MKKTLIRLVALAILVGACAVAVFAVAPEKEDPIAPEAVAAPEIPAPAADPVAEEPVAAEVAADKPAPKPVAADPFVEEPEPKPVAPDPFVEEPAPADPAPEEAEYYLWVWYEIPEELAGNRAEVSAYAKKEKERILSEAKALLGETIVSRASGENFACILFKPLTEREYNALKTVTGVALFDGGQIRSGTVYAEGETVIDGNEEWTVPEGSAVIVYEDGESMMFGDL